MGSLIFDATLTKKSLNAFEISVRLSIHVFSSEFIDDISDCFCLPLPAPTS